MPVLLRWSETTAADPSMAGALRRRLRSWALGLGIDNSRVDDIALGVYEALANVVEHAYRSVPEQGTMTITVAYERETLTVTVADTGTWRPPVPTTDRNHGLQVAAAVTDDLVVDHRPGLGTVVTATWNRPVGAMRNPTQASCRS